MPILKFICSLLIGTREDFRSDSTFTKDKRSEDDLLLVVVVDTDAPSRSLELPPCAATFCSSFARLTSATFAAGTRKAAARRATVAKLGGGLTTMR